MRRRDQDQLPLFAPNVPFGPKRPSLEYVIQKHRATRLHFDLRLQVGRVMKSWAIREEGPSTDPLSPRLAVQVRDHAKTHNKFEGVIPPGGNGAGPVMIWDRGEFAPNESGAFDVEKFYGTYEAGVMSFVLLGERLHGRWTLIRRRDQHGERSQWDLRKYPDEFSRQLVEPVDAFRTSVVTGRTMAEIEAAYTARHLPNGGASKASSPHFLRKSGQWRI